MVLKAEVPGAATRPDLGRSRPATPTRTRPPVERRTAICDVYH
jgi:hypothetical protein